MPTDFTLSSDQILTDLINADNHTSLAVGALRFGTPRPTPTGSALNTAVSVTGIERSGCVGTVEVRYNRINIDTVPGTRSRQFDKAAFTTTAQLLPQINAAYGINLMPADVVDEPLPILGLGDLGQLRIQPSCLVYYGQLAYQLPSA